MHIHTNKSALYKVENLHAFCVLSTYLFGRRQTGKGRKGERDWCLLNTYNMLVTGLYSLHMLLPLILTPRQEAPSEGTLWVRERGSFPSERADSHAKIIQKESSTLQRDVLWED